MWNSLSRDDLLQIRTGRHGFVALLNQGTLVIWDRHLPEQDCGGLGSLVPEISTSEGLPKYFVAHTLKLIFGIKEPYISASGIDITVFLGMRD